MVRRSEVILQSELDAFCKANIPPNETVLAEWILKTLRKGRLIHSHHVGGTYLLVCTDRSLYMLKLNQKKIHSHSKHSLMDFTNIQVGYLSKSGEDALDECEVNPGLYALRLYFGPNEYKTFKHPSNDTHDDAQKALIQVIFSQIKATRRELYLSSPQLTAPLAIPSKNNNNNNNNNDYNNSFPPVAATSARLSSSAPSAMKQDSFMITLQGQMMTEDEALEGVLTITQKHFVFEPSVGSHDAELLESITVPLFKIAECIVLPDDEIPIEYRIFVMKNKGKMIQMFADGRRLCFVIPYENAETTRTRLAHWVTAAQDKLAQEIISMTQIQYPLLTKDDTTTSFKGDSDIVSARDVSYLQFKMPDRHSMDKWELVYSTTKHGISINTFFTKVANRVPSVIIIEDTNHHVFGGYASEPWVKTKQVHYGDGESFLFKLKPVSKVFKWSKLNDYFLFSKPDFISFGSGGEGYGLWLDADFDHGSSATSETYLNEPLSSSEQFKVLKMEVWAPPVFYQKKVPRPL